MTEPEWIDEYKRSLISLASAMPVLIGQPPRYIVELLHLVPSGMRRYPHCSAWQMTMSVLPSLSLLKVVVL